MTTTNIIEIKEQNANTRYENGRFSLNLKNHLTLNEGDELNIRNIYIDSKKESNTISVQEDIILSMEVCGGWTFNSDYIVHYGSTDGLGDVNTDKHLYIVKEQAQTGSFVNEDKGFITAPGSPSRGTYKVLNLGNTDDSEGRGNCITYYPCYLYDAVGGDYKKLTFLQISVQSVNFFSFGGFQGVFQYTNASGNKSTITYTIPKKNSNVLFFDVEIIDGIIYKESDGLTLIHPSPQDLKNVYNVQDIVPNGDNVNSNKILHPKGQTINIPIKAGNYQPSILAEKINFYVNNLNYNLESFINEQTITRNGPIFQNQGATLYGEVSYGGDTGNKFMFDALNQTNGINQYYHMVSEDDSNSILKMGASVIDSNNNITACNRLLGGASNFEIIFDDVTQTFKISNLHTPYYVSIGNVSQIGAKLQDFDVSGLGRIMTMNTKRADLKIFSLTTNEKTGNFWFDKLGFDESILTPLKSRLRTYGGTTGDLNVPIFNFNIKDDFGTRRTDCYTSLQLKLDNERFNPDYLQYSGDGNSPTPLLAPISDTIDIFGTKTLNDLIIDDAYFKIIIDGIATTNKLYDEENIKLISAIVGKYYSGESYTNGFSTDGITYIHRGIPITLNNFNINILSSKNTKPNIGPDNTIIIQVNKNEIIQETNKNK